MNKFFLFLFVFTPFLSNTIGQTITVFGKVINENLEVIPEVRIENSDTVLLATTDTYGKFVIKIPTDAKIILFSSPGYEWKSIHLTTPCDTLGIILMYSMTYDYISLSKVDKLRMKRFKKLPGLYSEAYKRGIFYDHQPCYEQKFNPVGKK